MILLYIIKRYFNKDEQKKIIELYNKYYISRVDTDRSIFIIYYEDLFRQYLTQIKFETFESYQKNLEYYNLKYDGENDPNLLFDNWYDEYLHRDPILNLKHHISSKTTFKSGVAPYPLEKFQSFIRPDNLKKSILDSLKYGGFYNIPIWHHSKKGIVTRYKYNILNELYKKAQPYVKESIINKFNNFINGNRIFIDPKPFIHDCLAPFLLSGENQSLYGGLNAGYYMYYYYNSPLILKAPINKTLVFDTKLHAMIYLVKEYVKMHHLTIDPIKYITKLFELSMNKTIDDPIFSKFNTTSNYQKRTYISECESKEPELLLDVHIRRNQKFEKLMDYNLIGDDEIVYNNFYIEYIDIRLNLIAHSLGYKYIILLKEPTHREFQLIYKLDREKIQNILNQNLYYVLTEDYKVIHGFYNMKLVDSNPIYTQHNFYKYVINDNLLNFNTSMIIKISNDFKYNLIELNTDVEYQQNPIINHSGLGDSKIKYNIPNLNKIEYMDTKYSNSNVTTERKEFETNSFKKFELEYQEYCKEEYKNCKTFFNLAC